MGESLGLGKKSYGTNTETQSWFWLPIPKPGFGRTLFTTTYFARSGYLLLTWLTGNSVNTIFSPEQRLNRILTKKFILCFK